MISSREADFSGGFDIVSVGHVTVDSIFLPDRRGRADFLGGSVVYASLVARRLDATVSVVSKVGQDFPDAYLSWLEQEGVDLSGLLKVEDVSTTRFQLRYSDDLSSRELQLCSRAPPITLDDFPRSLKAETVHIAPVAGEITYEVVEGLGGCAQCLSLDPQGLLRDFGESGNVTLKSLMDERILELVNIYKSSMNEIKALTGLSDLESAMKAVHDYGVEIVVVTLGKKGAVLSFEGATHVIPVYETGRVVDPTGAGDVFIGAFLAEYLSSENAVWSACVGSTAASLIVETAGPIFVGDGAEIRRRALKLYEKGIER